MGEAGQNWSMASPPHVPGWASLVQTPDFTDSSSGNIYMENDGVIPTRFRADPMGSSRPTSWSAGHQAWPNVVGLSGVEAHEDLDTGMCLMAAD